MTIRFIDTIGSTQEFIIDGVKDGTIKPPFMLVAGMRTDGIGSRGNDWQGLAGNLFMSFCVYKHEISSDVPPSSLSIYFAMILREFLRDKGSQIWLKWPNDFYINEHKIGGAITAKVGEIYICGIGLNLVKAPKNAGVLDISLTPLQIAENYKIYLQKQPSWQEIFAKFSLDFERSKPFFTHNLTTQISLNEAILCEDGSILANGERIFSMR